MALGYNAAEQLTSIADEYDVTGDLSDAVVPDFHSVRQALNVAAADQRLLVLINGSQKQLEPLRKSLRSVAGDKQIIGRFHFDFEYDDAWKKKVKGSKKAPGITIIRPDEFGQKGTALKHLPLDSESSTIVNTLLTANDEFARTTQKKVYSQHVRKGNRLGIYFEGAVPYGEDRDGDGEIDTIRGQRIRP